jgi:hypothetical protein
MAQSRVAELRSPIKSSSGGNDGLPGNKSIGKMTGEVETYIHPLAPGVNTKVALATNAG